ncbi:MAG: hypothetical protein OXI77_09825 [Chloroflexota bacterium]|nr:hypothetical protein [Chloroflexota bacterium]MDE2907811.1 hypothetical protein [Chloroflexota bacterium]
MTTVPRRLGVKFSLKQQPTLKPDDILPIFQRWIQEHRIEGMLIDVIDYKHVPYGPGIVLIADEADIAYDLSDGETGLHFIRKRALPACLSEALRLVFRSALEAARALEAEAPGDIVFDFSAAKISFLDRMNYRNESAIFEETREALTDSLSEIFGAPVTVSRFYDDPRAVFAIRCSLADSDFSADAFAQRFALKHQAT